MALAKPRIVPHLVGESVRLLRESVRSKETWKVYHRRFVRFLQWLGFENNVDKFLAKAKTDLTWAEFKFIDYIAMRKGRVCFDGKS